MLTPSGPSSHARYRADVVLMGVIPFGGVVVTGTEIGRQGLGLLIGMDIISKGDIATSCKDGRTQFTFRKPSTGDADFAQGLAGAGR